jgi:DNA topoisomerase-3
VGRTLIIAEKPSVAADIAKVVGAPDKGTHAWEGEGHVVSWAVGHLLEFVPPEGYDDNLKRWRLKDLPILPEDFKLSPIKGSTKQLNALKKYLKAKDIDRVVNACDAGREGELIFREIYRYSGSKKPVDRLWLQSMTGKAIKSSLDSVRANDEVQGLADAADCRAESDWLIGMNATRALTVRLRSQRDKVVWSAGRVQTATLAMLVRREREILAHEPKPYWLITAEFGVDGNAYNATWYDPEGDAPRDRIFDVARRDALIKLLESKPAATAKETRKDSRETAPALFDLTSLQREGNRRFGFSARRTLSAAQGLYETHKLITYPRSDSRALPSDYREKVDEALAFLGRREVYAPHVKRLQDGGLENEKRNFDDSAISDHFAIIPTGEGTTSGLRADEQKIWDLVVRRFLASFHPPAISTEVERITTIGEESFRTRRKVLKEPGWRAVFDKKADDGKGGLPALPKPDGTAVELNAHVVEEKQTRPPARITEAGLLALMESAGKEVDDRHLAAVLKETGGLGTPATRAETIETLIAREYSSRCTTTDGRKALRATPRGLRLIDALERINLPQLTSAELTADLEDSLKNIEKGSAARTKYMEEIRTWTKTIVDHIRDFTFDTLYEGTEPLTKCPVCSKEVFENLRTYTCTDGGPGGTCEFVIWKEVGGRYVDRGSATQLCVDGRTPVKAGFFTRDHREYEARLVRDGDGRVRVQSTAAENEDGEIEVVDVAACPHNDGLRIRRTAQGYRCDGHSEAQCPYGKKNCRLSLPLTLCQKEITPEQVQKLLGPEHKTELIEGFISRRNRPFNATLHLEDNGRIRWEFPPRERSGGAESEAKKFPVNPEPIGPCPLSDSRCPGQGEGKIVETETDYACNADGCRVKIPREICKRELTREEADALFNKKETAILENFTSRAGKPFSASLYVKKNGRHGFRFGAKE